MKAVLTMICAGCLAISMTGVYAADDMMKKDGMKKDGMHKDEMKKDGMMKKDDMKK